MTKRPVTDSSRGYMLANCKFPLPLPLPLDFLATDYIIRLHETIAEHPVIESYVRIITTIRAIYLQHVYRLFLIIIPFLFFFFPSRYNIIVRNCARAQRFISTIFTDRFDTQREINNARSSFRSIGKF